MRTRCEACDPTVAESGWERSSPARAPLWVKCAPSVHAVCTCVVERKALAFLEYSACTTQRAHLFVSKGRRTMHVDACMRWALRLPLFAHHFAALALGTKGPNNWNTLGETMARASRLKGFVCWYCLTFGHYLGIVVSDTAIRWRATPTRSHIHDWRSMPKLFFDS